MAHRDVPAPIAAGRHPVRLLSLNSAFRLGALHDSSRQWRPSRRQSGDNCHNPAGSCQYVKDRFKQEGVYLCPASPGVRNANATTGMSTPRRASTRHGKSFPYEEWRNDRPIIRTAIDHLGPVAGRRLLMPAVGPLAVLFARAGAEVWGFDIAEAQVSAVQGVVDRYELADRIHLAAMPFEELVYPDDSFDIVFGAAILHHIDLDRGAAELKRVMVENGRASFTEPLGSNPMLEFARRHIPYPGKGRTEDERPLTYRDARQFIGNFPGGKYREFGLFGMLAPRFVRDQARARSLREFDERLLRRAPSLRRLCQQISGRSQYLRSRMPGSSPARRASTASTGVGLRHGHRPGRDRGHHRQRSGGGPPRRGGRVREPARVELDHWDPIVRADE